MSSSSRNEGNLISDSMETSNLAVSDPPQDAPFTSEAATQKRKRDEEEEVETPASSNMPKKKVLFIPEEMGTKIQVALL